MAKASSDMIVEQWDQALHSQQTCGEAEKLCRVEELRAGTGIGLSDSLALKGP